MRSLVYFIIPDQKLASNAKGATFAIPTLTYGQDWELAFRFLDRVEGKLVEVFPYVRHVTASIGLADQRPGSGGVKIKVTSDPSTAGNTTDFIDWNIGQEELKTKLNALADKPDDFEVVAVDGSFLIRREDGEELDISIVANTLQPLAFGEIVGTETPDFGWRYELRFVQAPLAFRSAHTRVDPAQPSIEPMADGGKDAVTTWNELQKLVIPPAFRGGFIVRNPDSLARTARLDNTDTRASFSAALTALMGDSVTVRDSQKPGEGFIEFNGDSLAGIDQPLLEAEVIDAPRGDVTIHLPIGQPAMRAALRSAAVLKDLSLDIEFDFVESLSGEDNDEVEGKIHRLSDAKVTVRRGVHWSQLADVPDVDWSAPPRDRTVMRWNVDNVAQGVQHYINNNFGNNSASQVITHGLDSMEVASIVIYVKSTGVALVHGTHFNFKPTGDDTVEVTFLGTPPASNTLHLTLTMAIPVTAFAGHTHDTAQIARGEVPLNTILDDLGERVGAIEALTPSIEPGVAVADTGIRWEFPRLAEVLFYDGDMAALFTQDGIDASKLDDRPPVLLPACHDATVTNITALPAVTAGQVWKNNDAPVLTLPTRGGLFGMPRAVKQNEFIASDSRMLFKAHQSNALSTTFYPTAFNRELWRVFIPPTAFVLGRKLEAKFGVAVQLLKATTNAQWLVVVEFGTVSATTSPTPYSDNLQNVTFGDPLLRERVLVTPLLQAHSFGLLASRGLVDNVDTVQFDGLRYGNQFPIDSAAPEEAGFVLRARLVDLDTENDVAADARGWLAYQLTGPDGTASTKPQLVIS